MCQHLDGGRAPDANQMPDVPDVLKYPVFFHTSIKQSMGRGDSTLQTFQICTLTSPLPLLSPVVSCCLLLSNVRTFSTPFRWREFVERNKVACLRGYTRRKRKSSRRILPEKEFEKSGNYLTVRAASENFFPLPWKFRLSSVRPCFPHSVRLSTSKPRFDSGFLSGSWSVSGGIGCAVQGKYALLRRWQKKAWDVLGQIDGGRSMSARHRRPPSRVRKATRVALCRF